MKTKSYIWITILCALCILVSCTAPTTETESIPGESSSLDSHSSQVSMESILETLSEEQSTSAEESTVSQATGETSTEESQLESEISDNTSEDESRPEISDDPSEDASQPEEDEKDEIKIYPELRDDPNHECASSHWRYDETTHWDQCLCGQDLFEERHLFGLWEDGTDNTVQRTCRTCSYTQSFQKADTPKLEYIVNSDGKT